MQYEPALESLRSSLQFVNKIVGKNKTKAKSNDFASNTAMKTLVEITEIDSLDEDENHNKGYKF